MILGAVASEVRILCDLEQAEPTWYNLIFCSNGVLFTLDLKPSELMRTVSMSF